MTVILVPGFWLTAESWSAVVPALEEAGHDVLALTLPGLESPDEDRASIRLSDHVGAVVQAIAAVGHPVVLVGHSGGASVVAQAADAHPELVSRLVYVDSAPPSDGQAINDELPTVDGQIPLPDWEAFDEPDLRDLTPELRELLRSIAVPHPAHVATDPAVLVNDAARRAVPAVMITSSYPAELVQQFVDQGAPFAAEWAATEHRRVIEVPTGHWPQFTKPTELAAALLEAIG